MSDVPKIGRHQFLQRSAQFAGGVMQASALTASVRAAAGNRLKVPAMVIGFIYRSHALVALEDFVEPYLFSGTLISSDLDVVSMYADQLPDGKTGRALGNHQRRHTGAEGY